MPGAWSSDPAAQYGRRLIPNIIDERAQSELTKTYASIPRSKALADGFVDISYALLANAVNKASWWLLQSMGNVDTQEVFAYMGPNDLRYPILVAASMKCGYQIMLPSPRNSAEYQQALFEKAGCHTVFCSRNLMAKTAETLDDLDVFYSVAPELADLLDPSPVTPFPYDVTYDEVKKEPFLILHTSGSTGPPKPIIFTVECTTTDDTHRLLDDPEGRLWWRLFAAKRYFSGMPCYHSAGIWFALFLPLYFDSTIVLGPGDRPLTASIADAVHQVQRVAGGIYPPSVLEDISQSAALENIKNLDFVAYGGGPLSKSAGDKLSRQTILHNFIGFTEASAPPRYIMEPEDWNYFEFHPASGFVPGPLQDDLYRLVFKRVPECEFIQTAFRLFPNLREYSPGDLLCRHPTKPNLWTHKGRVDDLVVLSTGEKFNPVPVEMLLKGCQVVKDSLLVGDGRTQAALLVECDPFITSGISESAVLDALWPFVQMANDLLPTQGRLMRSHIALAPAGKEFVRLPKGSVQRKATIAKFETEINELYSGQKPLVNGIYHRQLDQLNSPPRPILQTESVFSSATSSASSVSSPPASPRTVKPQVTDPFVSEPLPPQVSAAPREKEDLQPPRPSQAMAINIVRSVLSGTCGIHNVREDDDLFEFGLDSILALQISNELQGKSYAWPQDQGTGLELIYSKPTIRDLATAISGAKERKEIVVPALEKAVKAPVDEPFPQPAESDAVSSEKPDLVADLIQKFTSNLAESMPRRPITVAITGSTGSIGSHILNYLNSHPRVAKIICLSRTENGEQAQEAAYAKHRLLPPAMTKPVDYFKADLSDTYLGLKPWQYATLQREVDVILHCAWKLDFLQPVKSFEKTHIEGVRHLVDLAAGSERRSRIVFLSSIGSVIGWKEEHNVPEEIFTSAAVAGDGGYAQSKHIAERILYGASKSAGVQATVVRLGQIAGPTPDCDGIWNPSDWLPQIVSASEALGAVPKSLGLADSVDWVPINRIPDILMDIVEHDLAAPEGLQVYHVANPNLVSWGALLPAVCHKLDSETKLVSYQQWLALLQKQVDLSKFPALRLLSWLKKLDGPPHLRLPALALDKTVISSVNLSTLPSVCGQWMERWMDNMITAHASK